ncbi:Pyruvate/Phosphoenolpyruvate kinase-like domain-containing protein, partial [Penicillium macrosclerotiorum]|uniref:Pyruvate/Phosphoenolpyruvate kinase-like domain-containing protein n=1 Tax=Penicillium macrosclerotiorum TaxID=303699 RepID=UPI0025471092
AMAVLIPNPQLRLLNALRASTKPIMTFLGLPSFRTAQVVAQTGLDLDCRYRSFGGLTSDSYQNDPWRFNQESFGCWGTWDYRSAGQYCRRSQGGCLCFEIPPQGCRGQGSAFPAIAHGVDIATYLKTANETLITCIQIESKTGVDNVDAICAVPGVDMIFIGPNDLALSILGYVPAKGTEPEFVQAIEKIVAAARKHGKWVGRLSNNGSSCKGDLKVFDTVAMGYDIRAIQNWYSAELQVARS